MGIAPDGTAVRTALWRALHVEVDAPPHVLDDRLGLTLAETEHIDSATMNARYFTGRPDGLAMSRGEEMLVART